MQCRINPKYHCSENMKVGKGEWDYLKPCLICTIFTSSGQIVFLKNKNGELEMTEPKKIPDWVKARAEKQKTEPESEFYKLPEGETTILINEQQAPEEVKGKFGTQYVYEVFIEGVKQKLSTNRRLDRLIIKAMMNGLNPMTVIRVGTDINTKYAIKGLD